MAKLFKFKTELWIPVYTGVKVETLDEFINALRTIDIDSVFYHVYINLFNYHNMPVYFPNSFAYWLYKNNFILLAEKVSAIDPLEIYDLEELRHTILEILEKNYPSHLAELRKRLIAILEKNYSEDMAQKLIPFYFVKAEREIIDCGITATTMEEFINGIKESSINSVFYHLVTSKLQKKSSLNDYSAWLLSIGESTKANLINQLDIYNHTLYDVKEKIIKILEGKV